MKRLQSLLIIFLVVFIITAQAQANDLQDRAGSLFDRMMQETEAGNGLSAERIDYFSQELTGLMSEELSLNSLQTRSVLPIIKDNLFGFNAIWSSFPPEKSLLDLRAIGKKSQELGEKTLARLSRVLDQEQLNRYLELRELRRQRIRASLSR